MLEVKDDSSIVKPIIIKENDEIYSYVLESKNEKKSKKFQKPKKFQLKYKVLALIIAVSFVGTGITFYDSYFDPECVEKRIEKRQDYAIIEEEISNFVSLKLCKEYTENWYSINFPAQLYILSLNPEITEDEALEYFRGLGTMDIDPRESAPPEIQDRDRQMVREAVENGDYKSIVKEKK
jgi:hypothetical protein